MHCYSLLQGIFLTQIDLTSPVLAGGPFYHRVPREARYRFIKGNKCSLQGKVLVAQWCPTLYYTTDWGPPGFSVHGILQARILEWVAILFSKGIFPTQGSNTGLLYCRPILYRLSHQGSPYKGKMWIIGRTGVCHLEAHSLLSSH